MKIIKSRSVIDNLFSRGEKFKIGNILAIYLDTDETEFLFAVSSKKYPRAVDRNRIKRLMKESARKKEMDLNKSIAFVYTNNEIVSYSKIDTDISRIIKHLKND